MNKGVIFITGATGFIGSNLLHRLIKEKYKIHILLRKDSNTEKINDIIRFVTIHKADTNKLNLNKLLQTINPNYIFSLATYGNYRTEIELEKLVKVNILDLVNLLIATKNINYKSFIITGTSSEYGIKTSTMKETDLLEPSSLYACTKASATLISQAFAKIYKKPIAIFRLFSVYGPRENSNRLIPTAIKAGLNNSVLYLTEKNIRRDFIYIDDVIEALIKGMKTTLSVGEILNIGTGKQYSNHQVVKIINSVIDKEIKISKHMFKKRSWDTNYWVADIKKSKKMLNWEAQYSLREGITKTVTWFKNNNEKV